MKVSSTKDVDFPAIGWGIRAGEEKEAPADEKEKERILLHPSIREVGKGKVESEDKEETGKIEGNYQAKTSKQK